MASGDDRRFGRGWPPQDSDWEDIRQKMPQLPNLSPTPVCCPISPTPKRRDNPRLMVHRQRRPIYPAGYAAAGSMRRRQYA